MYSTHNEGKSVVAERFIRTLKNTVYKYITSISRNVYTDKLDNIVNKYNNTYHRTTVGAIHKSELQKTNQKEFSIEKVIK